LATEQRALLSSAIRYDTSLYLLLLLLPPMAYYLYYYHHHHHHHHHPFSSLFNYAGVSSLVAV